MRKASTQGTCFYINYLINNDQIEKAIKLSEKIELIEVI